MKSLLVLVLVAAASTGSMAQRSQRVDGSGAKCFTLTDRQNNRYDQVELTFHNGCGVKLQVTVKPNDGTEGPWGWVNDGQERKFTCSKSCKGGFEFVYKD